MAQVTIELFGIPRRRAGAAQVAVAADTIGAALRQLESHCPQLEGLLQSNGSLSPLYLLSIDGERFVGNLDTVVPADARLLLFSADAGG
jgi:molybdopterin converting factor small subunit